MHSVTPFDFSSSAEKDLSAVLPWYLETRGSGRLHGNFACLWMGDDRLAARDRSHRGSLAFICQHVRFQRT